jgi:hypothetical protein
MLIKATEDGVAALVVPLGRVAGRTGRAAAGQPADQPERPLGVGMPDERRKTMKPTPADILIAIAKAELGDWIDPSELPLNWSCELYSPEGHVFNGNAHTAPEAMALAWLHAWAPDALINGYVEPGTVPFEIPFGWRFELTPPWRSKKD